MCKLISEAIAVPEPSKCPPCHLNAPTSFYPRLIPHLFTTPSIWITNPLAGIKRAATCVQIDPGAVGVISSGIRRPVSATPITERRTCCARPLALFPRAGFKSEKQGRSRTKTSFFHFLLQNRSVEQIPDEDDELVSPFSDWRWKAAMLAAGKALADCLCERFLSTQCDLASPPLFLPACLPVPPALHSLPLGVRQFW